MNNIILYILLILNILSFLLGYLYGNTKNSINNNKLPSFISNNRTEAVNTNKSNISISDKKVVVNIDTKGLEKKYEELGEKIVTHNDMSNSINKLKNLKG